MTNSHEAPTGYALPMGVVTNKIIPLHVSFHLESTILNVVLVLLRQDDYIYVVGLLIYR